MARKTFFGLAIVLVLAACNGAPPPAPTSINENPPGATAVTPAPSAIETDPGYPVEPPTEDPGGPYPVGSETPTDSTGYPVETEEFGYPAPPTGDCEFQEAAPQRHELTASDGTGLVHRPRS